MIKLIAAFLIAAGVPVSPHQVAHAVHHCQPALGAVQLDYNSECKIIAVIAPDGQALTFTYHK